MPFRKGRDDQTVFSIIVVIGHALDIREAVEVRMERCAERSFVANRFKVIRHARGAVNNADLLDRPIGLRAVVNHVSDVRKTSRLNAISAAGGDKARMERETMFAAFQQSFGV